MIRREGNVGSNWEDILRRDGNGKKLKGRKVNGKNWKGDGGVNGIW